MAVTTVKAELGGTVIDCLVYGLFLSVFGRAMQVLLNRKIYDRTSIFLVSTTVALFCLITSHLALDVDRAFRAFTSNIGTPNYPKDYFNILSGAEALAKNSAYVTITLIADAFLTFRCWAAFGQNYLVIIIPSALYIGNLATACWALVTFKEAENPTTGVVVVAEVISRVKYMYITTLCLNLYCSLAIASRIWLVQRQSTGTSGHLLRNTMTIITESAALYSVFLIILITSAALENPLMYAVLNPMPSIIGFVFSSIIVRVGSGRSFSTQRPTHSIGVDYDGGLQTRSLVESAMRFGRPRRAYHGEESVFGLDTTTAGGDRTTSILPTTSVHFSPEISRQTPTTAELSSSSGSNSIPHGKNEEKLDK
ncbi:hypothetical protein F5876DRAFT_68161 [Lentinula aff. lateritia]|uniref:Uncharacterized protein n=1 Tax=Lentinula aff. lateritia TaxID=2804960 RepID=A0ACC1TRM5_9AGAR|nr:hypothetical protein F5876DRAFT_68161 [Lentinula aff. lateritia]